MHKCPGAIIGLLVHLRAPRLSPSAAVPSSPSRKQRMFASGSGRAFARAPSVANSISASRAEAESLEAARWKPDVAAVTRSQIATCYAYTKVEQEARKKLTNIDWSCRMITDQRNAMCSTCCVCCNLNCGRCMTLLAPSNAALADGVARVLRRAGLDPGSATRGASRAS